MMFQLSLPWGPGGYVSYGKVAAFHEKLINRLNALPGITSVGVALRIPVANRGTPNLDMQLQPYDGDDRRTVPAVENLASAEYFHSIGIPLRAGRSVRSGDLRGAPAVVVSERLAMSLFATTEVVGRRIRRLAEGAPPTTFTIVGVVGDVHWDRIERGYVPMLYFPLLRDADGLPADSNPIQYLPMVLQYAVRGARLPSALAIQAIVSQLDPRVPVSSVRTLDSVVDDATAHVRLTMLLVGVAGAAALLLAMIGMYSVVAYAANGRVREFAIRLALGAEPTPRGQDTRRGAAPRRHRHARGLPCGPRNDAISARTLVRGETDECERVRNRDRNPRRRNTVCDAPSRAPSGAHSSRRGAPRRIETRNTSKEAADLRLAPPDVQFQPTTVWIYPR